MLSYDSFENKAKANAYYSLFCHCAQRASTRAECGCDEVLLGVIEKCCWGSDDVNKESSEKRTTNNNKWRILKPARNNSLRIFWFHGYYAHAWRFRRVIWSTDMKMIYCFKSDDLLVIFLCRLVGVGGSPNIQAHPTQPGERTLICVVAALVVLLLVLVDLIVVLDSNKTGT